MATAKHGIMLKWSSSFSLLVSPQNIEKVRLSENRIAATSIGVHQCISVGGIGVSPILSLEATDCLSGFSSGLLLSFRSSFGFAM